MNEEDIPKEIQVKIDQAVLSERQLTEVLRNVSQLETQTKKFWKEVETAMINADRKSFKGDFGSLTIVEKQSFSGDLDQVPRKYIKKALDTKAVNSDYKLTNILPKGVTVKNIKYLMKRVK